MSQRDRSGPVQPGPDEPHESRRPRQERTTDTGAFPGAGSSWTTRPSRPPVRRQLDDNQDDVERYLDQRNREAAERDRSATRRTNESTVRRRSDTGEIRTRPHQPLEVAPPAPTRATTEQVPNEDAERWEETVNSPSEPRVRRRTAPATSRRRPPARSIGRPVVSVPNVTMPRFVAEADLIGDRPGLVLLGISVFSAALMAAITSNLVGRVDPTIGIHVDAAGFTDRWADAASLWRIPLLVTMVTLINFTIAWFTASFDRFATRVLLGGTLLVHVVAWMALTDFL